MKTDVQLLQTAVHDPGTTVRPAILLVGDVQLEASARANQTPALHINEILRRLVEEHKRP